MEIDPSSSIDNKRVQGIMDEPIKLEIFTDYV